MASVRRRDLVPVAMAASATALLVGLLTCPSAGERAANARWKRLEARTRARTGVATALVTNRTTIAPEDFIPAWFEALCGRWSRCSSHPRDLELCLAQFEAPIVRSTPRSASLADAVRRHEMDYDGAAMALALAAYATSPCDKNVPNPWSLLHGLRHAGETCSHHLSCDADSSCQGLTRRNFLGRTMPSGRAGTCVANKKENGHASPIGGRCGRGSWCSGEGTCDRTRWACVTPAAEGWPCVNGNDGGCGKDLFCDAGGTCRRRVALGAACYADAKRGSWPCAEGSCWPDGVCRLPADLGEPCKVPARGAGGWISHGTCRGGLTCIALTPGADAGTCQVRRAEGERCAFNDECRTHKCGHPDASGVCVDQDWHPWIPLAGRRAIERIERLAFAIR